MTIQTLNIDLETKSGTGIGKAGVYRYAEDPDFDILLFGVFADETILNGPVYRTAIRPSEFTGRNASPAGKRCRRFMLSERLKKTGHCARERKIHGLYSSS